MALCRLLLWIIVMLLPAALAGQSVRFAVIGDSGTGDAHQLSVARQMEKFYQTARWEFVLMLGDNIYDEGEPRFFDAKFKNVYRNLMQAGVRFHATLGNHDRVHSLSRKGMAQVEDPAFGFIGGQDEYVLVAGPQVEGKPLARFIALNSDAWIAELPDSKRIEARLGRLRQWLADSDRFHWNFAYFHNPLYAFVVSKSRLFGFFTGGYGHGPEEQLRRLLEPELTGRVQAVFSGHEHFYQKIRPQNGIHYFISGGGGRIRKGAVKNHPEVEFAAETLHFLDLELTSTHLRYAAISDQGVRIHSGVITR